MIFVGVDWAEEHHDVDVRDEHGAQLAATRVRHGVVGLGELHDVLAGLVEHPDEVVVGIETDRGLLVSSLVAAGYRVHAINPRSVDRYRDRYALSGAKSDPGDAMVLAELVRSDRHHHRRVAGDSTEAEGLKVLARNHQNLIWSKTRHVLQLRNLLLEFYPAFIAAAAGKVGTRDALAVLSIAADPAAGQTVSRARIVTALRRAGRQRYIDVTADRFFAELRAPHLTAAAPITISSAASAKALVAVIAAFSEQIEQLELLLVEQFNAHEDAPIISSIPGLGAVLGARILAEFGDDPDRYADARSRKNYAGTSPITRASGKSNAVLARFVRNRRLADACNRWAFASLSSSPGSRRYYDDLRRGGKTHSQALKALSNRLVGVLHGCLEHQLAYDERIAWHRYHQPAA
jgi:transposase